MDSVINRKLLELTPIHFDHNDCLEDQLVSVIAWFNKDIPVDNLIWHLSEAWDFSFTGLNEQNSSLGKRLKSDSSKIYDCYKNYYSVEVNNHHAASFEDFIEKAGRELSKDKPVVIIQKSFWIPWDPNYNVNQEYEHAYIVIAVDCDSEQIIASDGLYMKKNIHIDFDNVKNGFTGEFITFDYTGRTQGKDPGRDSWADYFDKMLKRIRWNDSNNSIFKQMNDFAEKFEMLDDIKSENNDGSTNFVASELYQALSVIINRRKQLAQFMKYLETKYNMHSFSDFNIKFDLAASKWYEIQHKMLKASFLPDFTPIKKRIVNSIYEVADLEKGIAEEMNEFIHFRDGFRDAGSSNSHEFEKLTMLDLKQHFNNKGFGRSGISGSSFAATGQYFSSENLALRDIWEIENMSFEFPDVYNSAFDNLYCDGQIISIEPEKHNTIMTLGCSEVNNFSGEVEIHYSDRSNEKIIISLSDWYRTPQFGDTVAWQGHIVEKSSEGTSLLSTHEYKIFASKYTFNSSKKCVTSIKLPECNNMHLFAISLGVAGQKNNRPAIREISEITDVDGCRIEEESSVTGEHPVLPNREILDMRNRKNDINHWNIGVMLEVYPIPQKQQIESVIKYLLNYHDGLRLRLCKEGAQWKEYIVDADGPLPITYFDFSNIDETLQKDQIEKTAEELQNSSSLSEKPVSIGVFYLGEKRAARILILVHHVLADGYGMTILGQDFCTAYSQVISGEKIKLPQKTTSLKSWAEYLKQYAQSEEVLDELDYWLPAAKSGLRIPLDFADERENNYFKFEREAGINLLSKEEMDLLFQKGLNRDVDINFVVVTALFRAIEKWTGKSEMVIDYVFSGRNRLNDSFDLSRTIAWLNHFVPVYVNLAGKSDIEEVFNFVKDRLRSIPKKGFGYGCLRNLCDDTSVLERMAEIPFPEIMYNYFNKELYINSFSGEGEWGYIRPALESAGENEGQNIYRGRLISVVAERSEDGLYCKLQYSCNIHKEETMHTILKYMEDEIHRLLDILLQF